MAVKVCTLSNGLRTVIYPMPGLNSVYLTLVARGGSRFESAETVGISHITEHLVQLNQEIISSFEAIGGKLNGSAEADLIVFKTSFPARRLEEGLRLFVRALRVEVTEAEFERERGIIAEELTVYLDDPERIVEDLCTGVLWAGHPFLFVNDRIAFENLLNLTFTQFQEFRRRVQQGSQMALVAIGNFKARRGLELITKYFSEFPRGRVQPWRKLPLVQISGMQLVKQVCPLHSTYCWLGFGVSRFDAQTRLIQDLLEIYLGDGELISGRLFERVRQEAGLVHFIGATTESFVDGGYFCVAWECTPSKVKTIARMVMAELQLLAQEKIPLARFAQVKGILISRLREKMDEPESLCEEWASQLLLRGRFFLPKQQIKQLMSVSRSDVQRFAQAYLRPERSVLAMVGPVDQISP